MIRTLRRAWPSACGISRRSLPVKATSADSIAASDPLTPIAMPTVALASAGASLMPSPIMAVGVVVDRDATAFALFSGRSCAATSSMPACSAKARAVRSLSPVSILTDTPRSRSA